VKPLVYEWDHERQRYVTPGDRVECLKERVVAADDYVAEVERLRAEKAAQREHLERMQSETSDRIRNQRTEIERLQKQAIECGTHHPGYVIGIHWLAAAYGRICAGDPESEVMADYGYTYTGPSPGPGLGEGDV
jgi:hypothetical protein